MNDTETLTTAPDGRTSLRLERRLAHPPEKVWQALVRPEHLSRWFPSDVEIDELRVGGKINFVFRHGEGDNLGGEITELDPPRLLAYTWGDDHLRWELMPESLGSVLTLTHTFADHAGAASFASGWDTCVAAIDAALDGNPAPPRPDVHALHEAYIVRLGLDRATDEGLPDGGWQVRYERQLTQPAASAWKLLTGQEPAPSTGGPVPSGFTAAEFPPGPVTEAEPHQALAYDWESDGRPAGRIRWELGRGTGHGARLVVTQTGASGTGQVRAVAPAVWRRQVEALAKRLAGMPR
jgi:uncharacterized protein YndB with AHSA1/START domain